jgi:hypothetical protein
VTRIMSVTGVLLATFGSQGVNRCLCPVVLAVIANNTLENSDAIFWQTSFAKMDGRFGTISVLFSRSFGKGRSVDDRSSVHSEG